MIVRRSYPVVVEEASTRRRIAEEPESEIWNQCGLLCRGVRGCTNSQSTLSRVSGGVGGVYLLRRPSRADAEPRSFFRPLGSFSGGVLGLS